MKENDTAKSTTAVVKINKTQLKTMSPETVLEQVKVVHDVMKRAMKEGVHYGKIPGCGDKPTLLKPGAEKLNFTFRLAPTYEGERDPIQSEGEHREYIIKTTLTNILTGELWAQGIGSCSTMESKYRYRQGELACPECGNVGSIIRGNPQYNNGIENWVCWKKKSGCGETFDIEDSKIISQNVDKIENPCLPDQWNTVLKMAKKRSLVDATLNALAVSDIFTQDIEDGNTTQNPKSDSPVINGNGKSADDVELIKEIEGLVLKMDKDRQEKFKTYISNHYAKKRTKSTLAELIINNYADIKDKLKNDQSAFDLPF